MPNWKEKVSEQLNLHNEEGRSLDEACLEWRFTGKYKEHNQPQAKCELCGNTGLRHHYLIANKNTGEALWVGSQCILNFEESIYGEIKKVQRAKQKEEKRIIKESLIEEIMDPLAKLYELLPRKQQRKLHWVVGKFRRRGGFSPSDLVLVFKALNREEILFDAKIFPVLLRTQKEKVEILNLNREELATLWESLTEKQRDLLKTQVSYAPHSKSDLLSQ